MAGAPPLRILVVDDNEDNRFIYSEYLRAAGHDVKEATNGAEALEIAAQQIPDVVVMDLSMPVLDGWEATKRLREDKRVAHAYVIAVTGHGESSNRDRAFAAGVDDFVLKPFLPRDLDALIAARPKRR